MTMTLDPIADTTDRLDDAEFEEILDRLRDYVEQLEEASQHRGQANRLAEAAGSLQVAADMARLYAAEARWVPEIKATLQPKKGRGRPVNPRSRDSFFKWAKGKITSRKTGKGLEHSQSDRLLRANEVARIISPMGDGIRGVTERALRPLYELLAVRAAEIPAVWQRALKKADGQTPTNSHVKKALKEHNEALRPAAAAQPPREKRTVDKAKKAIIDQYRWLLADHAGPDVAAEVLMELNRLTADRLAAAGHEIGEVTQ